MREGDAGALGFYADNARIHVGDLGAVADQAYDAWAADRAAGLDSVLLAPTRDLVSRAQRPRPHATDRALRRDRPRRSRGRRSPTATAPRPATSSSPAATTAAWSSRRTDWVKNGDRWTVTQVHRRRLPRRAAPASSARSVELPADYVAEHVQLGYATTVHGAQGMTTDTCPHRPRPATRPASCSTSRSPAAARQPPLPRHRPSTATRTA